MPDPGCGPSQQPERVVGAEGRALAKVQRYLVPLLFLLYLVAYLDRVNVSFAASGLSRDLGLDPASYGFAAGAFFAGYILFEIPSNLLLHRLGARRWISRILLTWGLVAMAMGAMVSATQFDTLRLLLGMAEAGFFPGIVFYLSLWVPAQQRTRALTGFLLAIPMAGLLGGPISAALLSLDGLFGIAGWRWLFLMEGLPAVLLAGWVWVGLPDRPRDARWLQPQEARALEQALQRERCDPALAERRLPNLAALLHDRRILLLLAVYAGIYFVVTGFGFWIPRFVADALPNPQPSASVINLISAIPYALAVAAMLLVGRSAQRQQRLVLHVAIPLAIAAAALVLAVFSPSLWRLAFICLATAATFSVKGPFWSIPPLLMGGRTAAIGFAGISTSGSIGGLISPNVMGQLLELSGGESLALGCLAGVLLLAAALALQLRRQFESPSQAPCA